MTRLEVFLSPLAEYKLERLLSQIQEGWGTRARRKFLSKFEKIITQISIAPRSCVESEELKDCTNA